MKTRIVWTRIWEDEFFANLDRARRFLFIYLITNSRANLCGCYELSDRIVLFDTGLNSSELEDAKKALEPKARFYKGWVYLPNAQKLGGYSGGKNEVAIERELSSIPEDIRGYFDIKRYPIDRVSEGKNTPRNHKSEIRNHKRETTNKKSEDVDPKDLPADDWLAMQRKNKL